MASYNGNIDLLSLNQAMVLTGLDPKNANRPFVCIPLDTNEIKYEPSRQDANRMQAKLRVNIWPFSEAYKSKIRQSAQERGDNNASVPTHEMQMSFSTDFIKSIIKSFPKLVQQVIDANKDRNPNIANEDANDENTALFRAIQRRLNKRIASLYQPQPKNQPQQAAPQFGSFTGQTAAYVPPVTAQDPFDPSAYTDTDELPF